MIEIELPRTIKVGGFTYTIEVSAEHDRDLQGRALWAEHSGALKRIRVDSQCSSEQFAESFGHELLHALDCVYNNNKLTEEDTNGLAQGLFQVLEQLGIRFVKPHDRR